MGTDFAYCNQRVVLLNEWYIGEYDTLYVKVRFRMFFNMFYLDDFVDADSLSEIIVCQI